MEETKRTPATVPEPAPDPNAPPRRDLKPGEIRCGNCGYPAAVESGKDEDGKPVERILPHFGCGQTAT